ncbi:MAG TPA: transglutaminase family protein [Allosphingosinicella sp.]|jgi:transglutaminase-like putative cysteine protease
MRLSIQADLDYHFREPTDVLLALEVAQTPDQKLVEDLLKVGGAGPLRPIPDEDGISRRTWMRAQGSFHAEYRATVDVDHRPEDLAALRASELIGLPAGVVPYLWPSRYCEADRFEPFVEQRFGALAGGAKIQAMAEWVSREMAYVPGSSDTATTAADVFVSRQGVCRDYAHLLASFARAAGIPARLISAYAWRLDPPDFHALVEVWLDGAWHGVDASGLAPPEGLVRICSGRDATDIAFMTSFGFAEMIGQRVSVKQVDEPAPV